MNKISAVVTCFNNEQTIEKCIKSLGCAEEIVVLDSYSTDKTVSLLKALGCIVHQQKFKGFSQQKQDAINLTSHDWVLLLDSDEFLTLPAQKNIQQWKQTQAQATAYKLPRNEWVFWQWSHKWVRKNKFIRLFKKQDAHVSKELVHESVVSQGEVEDLNAVIKHYGETSISLKMDKINRYSQLAAEQKFNQGKRVNPIKLIFYPLWYFFKQYVLRRQVFNGWAGLINASLNSRYAFLKYAKLYELQKNKN